MCDPPLAADIISAVSRAVDVPVTVKFRRGYHLGEETALDFAKRAQEAGASGVAIHGRFAEQYYRGQADWGIIATIKRALTIPVIGNGDVKTGADARAMKEETSCDAVMIGRGAQGNPWIFASAKAALEKSEIPAAPSIEERLFMACRHAALLSALGGRNIVRMRKHAMFYVAGIPRATKARGAINACVTYEDFEKVFTDLLQDAQQDAQQGSHHDSPQDSHQGS
jgi:nifR3 family TIM-barrel protein